MGERIDGNLIAQKTKDELKKQVDDMISKGHRKPKLVVFLNIN